MATIELCDLCGGKSKQGLAKILFNGRLPAYKGNIVPPAPIGFKYNDESIKNSFGKVTYEKVWDNAGRVIRETKYLQPPKKFKEVEISYDLCELCFEKFIVMFESIKKKYHLEATEMKLIEDKNSYFNPFLGLLGKDYDEDDD